MRWGTSRRRGRRPRCRSGRPCGTAPGGTAAAERERLYSLLKQNRWTEDPFLHRQMRKAVAGRPVPRDQPDRGRQRAPTPTKVWHGRAWVHLQGLEQRPTHRHSAQGRAPAVRHPPHPPAGQRPGGRSPCGGRVAGCAARKSRRCGHGGGGQGLHRSLHGQRRGPARRGPGRPVVRRERLPQDQGPAAQPAPGQRAEAPGPRAIPARPTTSGRTTSATRSGTGGSPGTTSRCATISARRPTPSWTRPAPSPARTCPRP